MDESNSLKIDKTSLTKQTRIRLDKVTEIENYFHQEIKQRKLCSKKLIKYVATFDYIGKILIFLDATSGGVSIILFTSVVGAPVGIASAILPSIFSPTTGIIKKLLSITRNKKEKHDKILMLAKTKLNIIETLISQALIDMEISHEDFAAIFKEKDKHEKMKENKSNGGENENQDIMRLNSVNSRKQSLCKSCIHLKQ